MMFNDPLPLLCVLLAVTQQIVYVVSLTNIPRIRLVARFVIHSNVASKATFADIDRKFFKLVGTVRNKSSELRAIK